MKVLRNAEEDGYLDQAMIDGSLRIEVVKVTQYPPLNEQFFRRQFDFRFALAYARDIGLSNVLRKVRSPAGGTGPQREVYCCWPRKSHRKQKIPASS